MKHFQKFFGNFTKAFLLAGFLVACGNVIYADEICPKIIFDYLDTNIIGVWVESNGITRVLNGTYNSIFPVDTPTLLTDPSAYSVNGPLVLVKSTAPITGATAVVVYNAFDIVAEVECVLVSTATILGWNTTPIALSLNDGTEYPNTDYSVSISADGMKIIIIWSSFLTESRVLSKRSAISTDGGLTFIVT